MRKIRKYQTGGTPYQALGQFGSTVIDNLSKEDQYGVKDDAAAGVSGFLSGAGTGAAIGSVIPGLGTVAGGLVGGAISGINSLIGNDEAKKIKKAEDQRREYNDIQKSNARLINYDTQGSNNNQIYAKYGGDINPIYKYLNGGKLNKLSNDSVEVEGASHENGGVKLSPNVEVEGGETIEGLDEDKPFVFSEKLGFAQLHKPIAKAIGKMESKVPNNITNNTIRILKQKEEALKMQQEQFKEKLGLKGLNEYELGGKLKPYYPLSGKYISMDNTLIRIKK